MLGRTAKQDRILAQIREHRNPLTSLPLLLHMGGAKVTSPEIWSPSKCWGRWQRSWEMSKLHCYTIMP